MTGRFGFILSVIIGAAVILFSASLIAQPAPEDDGVLYIPPRLTVHVTVDDDIRTPRSSDEARSSTQISMQRKERLSTEELLPIIFFDGAGSTAIPPRYQTFFSSRQTDDYVDSGDIYILPEVKERYKYLQILNILGYRMQRYPASRIELEGGYSTMPGENAEVGTIRAEVVRDYLTTIWRIEPERIVLRPTRRMCDSSAHNYRQEEAQQVHIHTDDRSLFSPVTYYKISPDESIIYFDILIDPSTDPADVAAIDFVVSLKDEVVSRTVIPGHPDSLLYHLRGLWPAFQMVPNEPAELAVQTFFRLWDGTARSSNVVKFILNPEARRKRDSVLVREVRVDYLRLPYFQWRDSSLTNQHLIYLDEYIKWLLESSDERAGMNYRLSVSAVAEHSESLHLSKASVSKMQMYGEFETELITSLFSPERQFPVIFYGTEDDLDPEFVIRSWLGEEYFQQMEKLMRGEFNPEYALNDEGLPGVDLTLNAIAMGRSENVARYLRERIGANAVDTIEVDYRLDLHSFGKTPEARYYERSASITLEQIWQAEEEHADKSMRIEGYEESVEEKYHEGEYYREEEPPPPTVPE